MLAVFYITEEVGLKQQPSFRRSLACLGIVFQPTVSGALLLWIPWVALVY